MLDFFELGLKLDDLSVHVILSTVQVLDASIILVFYLESVSRNFLGLLLLILVGFHLPLLPCVFTFDSPLFVSL